MIHKSRVPDANKRGRLFESAIGRLAEWWTYSFFAVEPVGHIRSRTFDQVQKMIAPILPLGDQDIINLELFEEEDSEVIRTPKSLMKHALMRAGSRDTSAQLFTALCRALDVPARLVVSLQSVPWQAGVGRPKPKVNGKKTDVKGKGKERAVEDADADNDDGEEVTIPSTTVYIKGKRKAADNLFIGEGRRLEGQSSGSDGSGKEKEKAKPVIKLRKQKDKGNVLGSASAPAPRRESM